jgi:hypothetical protein
MPPRSKIQMMNRKDREELDQKLIANRFSGYCALSDWLKSKGYSISKSAIALYGEKFQQKLENIQLMTEQARVICETVGDDENTLADALTRLAQQKVFEAIVELESENLEKIKPDKLLALVASLNRSSVAVKKYQAEVRKKTAEAAEEVTAEIKEKGLSDETAALIRSKILGIAS